MGTPLPPGASGAERWSPVLWPGWDLSVQSLWGPVGGTLTGLWGPGPWPRGWDRALPELHQPCCPPADVHWGPPHWVCSVDETRGPVSSGVWQGPLDAPWTPGMAVARFTPLFIFSRVSEPAPPPHVGAHSQDPPAQGDLGTHGMTLMSSLPWRR